MAAGGETSSRRRRRSCFSHPALQIPTTINRAPGLAAVVNSGLGRLWGPCGQVPARQGVRSPQARHKRPWRKVHFNASQKGSLKEEREAGDGRTDGRTDWGLKEGAAGRTSAKRLCPPVARLPGPCSGRARFLKAPAGSGPRCSEPRQGAGRPLPLLAQSPAVPEAGAEIQASSLQLHTSVADGVQPGWEGEPTPSTSPGKAVERLVFGPKGSSALRGRGGRQPSTP